MCIQGVYNVTRDLKKMWTNTTHEKHKQLLRI